MDTDIPAALKRKQLVLEVWMQDERSGVVAKAKTAEEGLGSSLDELSTQKASDK